VIFELGDYDSSGNRMRETIERRACVFAKELRVDLAAIVNVALTREQVADHGIPTRPPKDSTHRRDDDDDDAAELDAVDALYPGLLGEWLEQAVEEWHPAAAREPALARERANRKILAGVAANFDNWQGFRGLNRFGKRTHPHATSTPEAAGRPTAPRQPPAANLSG
jgi:hypothetical protein